jgi:hypothetical protein
MILLAVASSGVDPRYLTPAQPFALIGLLLAIGRLVAVPSAGGGPPDRAAVIPDLPVPADRA